MKYTYSDLINALEKLVYPKDQHGRPIEYMEKDISDWDRVAYRLLRANEKHFGTTELCYRFQKNFRQIDMTDCGHTDMAIWTALNHSHKTLSLVDAMVADEESDPDGSNPWEIDS